MDLLSTIRKSGSRGGVNFSWDEVASSPHRENYLGHSLNAPVGRWQKGRDLNWYAKADSSAAESGETEEERHAKERKEEIRKVKEAEEDAIAKALGLPVTVRDTSGANAVEVGTQRQIGAESKPPAEEVATEEPRERARRHGDLEKRERRRHRSRSHSRDRSHRHGRRRHDEERTREHSRDRPDREERRRPRDHRSRSRSRSGERRRHRKNRSQDRERYRSRSREHRRRRRD